MCRRDDLKPGAVVVDRPTRKLYEVSVAADRATRLIDVASPIDQPRMQEFLTVNAVQRLELVRAAPSVEDTASVEEFGGLGTAPE